MEEDSDMFVVLIGNEEEDTEEENNKLDTSGYILEPQVKIEIMDSSELEKSLRESDEHGIISTMESETEDTTDFEDFDEEIQQTEDYSLPEKQDLSVVYSDLVNNDSDSLPEKVKKRATILKPEERHSFVQELILRFPELKQDENALIKVLAEAMSVKAPEPPKNCFIKKGIHFVCCIGSCRGVSGSEPAAKRHYQEKHGPRYLICFACGADFRSTTNLYKHEKRCRAPDRNLVLKARALFVGNKGRHRPYINRNIKPTSRRSSTYTCHLCAAQYKSRSGLRAHMGQHEGPRPEPRVYQCQMCPRVYTSIHSLTAHKRTHSGSTFICDLCGKVCKRRVTLISHLDTHRTIKKFGCEECDQRFASKWSRTQHVRTAHRKLPQRLGCQICPKRYPKLYLLRAHMLKKHDMTLMTKQMFFEVLPRLTEDQIEQARIVMKEGGD